jgi:beta-glucosidase
MKNIKTIKLKVGSRFTAFCTCLIFLFMACFMLDNGKFAFAAQTLTPTDFTTEYSSHKEVYEAANALNQRIVEEGIVLLKNEDNALPLSSGNKISVFGKNSANIAIGGTGSSTGSGSKEGVKTFTLYQSLEESGFILNPELVNFYENNSLSGVGRGNAPQMGVYLWGLKTGETPYTSYTDEVKNSYASYNDAALFVITRIGGEGYDLPITMQKSQTDTTPVEGAKPNSHYLELDQNESDLLAEICANPAFSKVIIIINASQQMELGFLDDPENEDYNAKIKGAVWIGGPGQTGIMALGRVLNGTVNPSGRTVDTYTRDFTKDPTWVNFGNTGRYATMDGETLVNASKYFLDYEEGIYLGYKYYETRGFTEKEADPETTWYEDHVVYPFGYGLSYTTFTWQLVSSNPSNGASLTSNGTIEVVVRVTNSGSVAGKDVVQLYYTAPYTAGGIEKSYVTLAEFAKTDIIEPGDYEDVTISINVRDMASYDWNDANNNSFKGYEVEEGDYEIKLMKNAHEKILGIEYTVPAGGFTYAKDEKTDEDIVNRFDDISAKVYNADPQNSGGYMTVMSRADFAGTFPTAPSDDHRVVTQEYLNSTSQPNNAATLNAYDEGKPWYTDTMPTYATEITENPTYQLIDFIGADYDDERWETLLDELTLEQMVTLIGDGAFHTVNLDNIGKPFTMEFDGPVGLVPRQVNGPISEADVAKFPPTCVYATEPVVAATWNQELVYEYGLMTGEEGIWGSGDMTYSGIYAPGANIHRTPFSGRNFEYYSEDGLLSGKMAAAFCKGTHEKGLYTFLKHYFLNDQETQRSGIFTWAEEQTLREIYLKPFELAIKYGNAMGLMTAYNHIGSNWNGASYALLTELTRGEWGFKGMVITDWTGDTPSKNLMIRVGTDLALGGSGVSKPSISAEYLTPTHVAAIRRATKAILYTVAQSNAMIQKMRYVSAPLPDFRQDIYYEADLGLATFNIGGDDIEVTYALSEDTSLPRGSLQFSSDGILSGVVESTSTTKFEVTVIATAQGFAPISATFTINKYMPDYSSVIAPTGYVNKPFYFNVAWAKSEYELTYELFAGDLYWQYFGGRPPSAALPQGLTVNPDGTITGIPTEVKDTYVIYVGAKTAGSLAGARAVEITILPQPDELNYSNSMLDSGKVGAAYSGSVATATGSDNITYTLKEGSTLPAGLTLAANGTITGTPTETVVKTFTVIASADGLDDVEATFIIDINAADLPLPLTFAGSTLSEATVDTEYTATIAATGSDSITYALKEGSTLPAGLSLAADGTITGTPTAEGVVMFKVIASAQGFADTEAAFVINVKAKVIPVLTFTGATLTEAVVNEAYTKNLAATGSDNVTFTLKSGSVLPEGLSLSEDGKITGTPTEEGLSVFVVIASAEGYEDTESTFVLLVTGETAKGCGGTIDTAGIGVTIILAGLFIVIINIGKREKSKI